MPITEIVVDDLGDDPATLTALVDYEIDEGEPMEMPSRWNETGYPGSPNSLIINSVKVSYWQHGEIVLKRSQATKFFALMDRIIFTHVLKNESLSLFFFEFVV